MISDQGAFSISGTKQRKLVNRIQAEHAQKPACVTHGARGLYEK
ncbi:hypothetical protein [Aquabacterium sp.]|nr:hypothetical protein [Aquabacterium sp.]